MTVATPPDPILPPRRRPWGILVLVAVLLAVVAYLAFSSIGNALVYYRTPSEVAALEDPLGQTLRLGGVR
jgi:cytochrome c-type biogenesis protein CcmE